MLQFAEEVKQKTNGRIIIKIFPNGQLGSETENLEQLQAGVIAMTKVSARVLQHIMMLIIHLVFLIYLVILMSFIK